MDEGGGGNERVGDIFRNVLNATWQLAFIRERGVFHFKQWFLRPGRIGRRGPGCTGRWKDEEMKAKQKGRTFEITSAVSAKLEHLCNPVLAKKSSINLVPMLYPLAISSDSSSLSKRVGWLTSFLAVY